MTSTTKRITWGTAALKCHVKGCERVTERRVDRVPTCIIHVPDEAKRRPA